MKEIEEEKEKKFLQKKHSLKINKKISEGGYGKVYLASSSYEKFIIKAMRFLVNDNYKKNFLNRECFLAKSFKYIHIIKTYEIRQDKYSTQYIYNSILMEYAIYDNLGTFLKNLYKQNLLRINVNTFWIKKPNKYLIIYFLNQFIETFQFLFLSNIVHFDIKLENFLLCSNYIVKLCDFSLTRQIEKDEKEIKVIKSTWGYQIPNFYNDNKIIPVNQVFKIDYFAMGIIIYYLIFGQHLFPIENKNIVNYYIYIDYIQKGKENIQDYIKKEIIDKELGDIIQNLINKDINYISNIYDLSDNKWINKNKKYIHKISEITERKNIKFLFELYKFDSNIKKKRKKYNLII